MMRRILTDHARRRGYGKHGGDSPRALDDLSDIAVKSDAGIVAVDEALVELKEVNEGLAKIVELRFFGGLEHDEIAAVLGVSNATVRRRFRIAKAWLYRRLSQMETSVTEAAERWRRIEALFDEAAALSADERAAFLSRECGRDLEMRSEIESLLAADERAGEFLGQPAVSAGSRLPRRRRSSAGGSATTRWSPCSARAA